MLQNRFSAYLFHTPLGLRFAMATLVAVPLTFAVSGLIRTRVPGLSRLL